MKDRIQSAWQLAKDGEWGEISHVVTQYWRSDASYVGLRRDISIPFAAPQASIPISVRQMIESDIPILFGTDDETLSGESKRQRAMGMRMVNAGLPTCYVAVTEDGQPCYLQWLIGHESNAAVQKLFGNRFPVLEPDEMLLENAFTLETWRGKGIMAAAMAQIAEKAVDHNARYVVTVVGIENVPSLKGCKKAGFAPYIARTDQWRRFQFSSSFGPLSNQQIPAFS